MRVLVTGGAGFIGSSVSHALVDAGHQVVIVDDLSSGRPELVQGIPLIVGDMADPAVLAEAVQQPIDTVVHCGARIVAPESVEDPIGYYLSNVSKTIELLNWLVAHNITKFVFSSSASVYGESEMIVAENSSLSPESPYARTKLMVEDILRDAAAANKLSCIILRYFNPIGADQKVRTGPYLREPSAVLGKIFEAHAHGTTFYVTGDGYPTRDGTGIRDYVHITDIARAHVAAIEYLEEAKLGYSEVLNLGSGEGLTVLELISAFEEAVGKPLKHDMAPARPGDIAGGYALRDKAKAVLGWEPERSVSQAIRDIISWLEARRDLLGY